MVKMFNATRGLLDQIEEGALDSKAPLADVLRKCVALGGRAGSDQLRDWARKELDGYGLDEEVPRYRVVPAIIAIDGANSAWKWTGQQISPIELPDFARDVIKQEVELRQGVAELERTASRDDSIRLQHAAMADLVTYMNAQSDVINGTIFRMYWQVSANSFHGVVDTIRTTLVSLVAELRSAGVADVPTAEAANAAVQVVVHNAKRSTIQVNTNQLSGGSSVSAQNSVQGDGDEKSSKLPVWLTAPWSIAIGLATIVAGVAGMAVWLDWSPFG